MLTRLFAAAVGALAYAIGRRHVYQPTLHFLYRAKLAHMGSVALGVRSAVPILGTFSGPGLRGNISRLDCSFGGSGRHAEAVYVLETDDGASIMMTERGQAPNMLVHFDTASEKYGWLNRAAAYATGSEADGAALLSVWQISPPA